MINQIKSASMQTIVNAWQKEGLINTIENESIKNFCLSEKAPLALYLRVLIGVGAFFSVIFFMGFLYAAHVIDFTSNREQIILGLIFVGLAIAGAHYTQRDESTVGHSFFIQTTLCFMWLGKLLFVMGLSDILNKTMGFDASVTLSLLAITVVTYCLYKMSVDNFVSPLIALIFLLITNTNLFSYNSHIGLVFTVCFILQLALAAFLFLYPSTKKEYIPLAYAIAFSLGIIIVYLCVNTVFEYGELTEKYNVIYINISLVVALAGAIVYSVKDVKKLLKEPFNVAILGSILLGLTSEPGILLGLFFMVVGYLRYEKVLLILGMILLGVFIFFYYYNLDVTLLMKSIILASSGMLMLAAQGYLSLRKLDKGV